MSPYLHPLMDKLTGVARQGIRPFNGWWQGLALREQRLLLVALPILLLWLLWQGLALPLERSRDRAQQRLSRDQAMLTRVKATASEIARLQRAGSTLKAPVNTPLDQLVNRTAGAYQLQVTGLKRSQGRLQVSLANVPFDSLLAWLVELEQGSGVITKRLRLKKTDKPGMVQVDRLELARK